MVGVFELLVRKAEEYGLQGNEEKTKYLDVNEKDKKEEGQVKLKIG